MKRKGFTLWEILGLLAILLIGFVVLFPVGGSGHKPSEIMMCRNNLKQIGLALQQYSLDFDRRLLLASVTPTFNGLDENIPLREKQPYGWADAIYPYIKNRHYFQCPTEGRDGSDVPPVENGYTDYWFNSNLSGIYDRNVKEPSNVLLFGEGNDGSELTDSRYSLSSFPERWIDNEKSPLYRHRVGANNIFLDGHAKFYPGKTPPLLSFTPK